MNFYQVGLLGDIFSPGVLMLTPAAPTAQPTKPMKDAPAAACHDTSLFPKIHLKILIVKPLTVSESMNKMLPTVDMG